MTYSIGTEQLAVGALVALSREGKSRSVHFDALDEYGRAVAEELRKSGDDVHLLLSRENTLNFIRDFSDYLDIDPPDTVGGEIRLKDEHSIEEVVDRFSGRISAEVFEALTDETAVEVLLNAMSD